MSTFYTDRFLARSSWNIWCTISGRQKKRFPYATQCVCVCVRDVIKSYVMFLAFRIAIGDEGAVAFLDKSPSLENVLTAILKAQGVAEKDDTVDVGSKMSKKVAQLRYFGPGRPDLKQFIVDTRDPTSLLYAAQHGREEMIRSRCRERCPDEDVDKNGLTALHYAAGRGDNKIVILLLELKAGVDTRNKDLRTPLMWAARNGHLDVCEELVRNKVPEKAKRRILYNFTSRIQQFESTNLFCTNLQAPFQLQWIPFHFDPCLNPTRGWYPCCQQAGDQLFALGCLGRIAGSCSVLTWAGSRHQCGCLEKIDTFFFFNVLFMARKDTDI